MREFDVPWDEYDAGTTNCTYCNFTGTKGAVANHVKTLHSDRVKQVKQVQKYICGKCEEMVTDVKMVDSEHDYCEDCYIKHMMENETNPGTRKLYTKVEAGKAWTNQAGGNRKNVIKRKKRTSKKRPSKKRPYKKRTSKKRKSKKRKSKKK